MPSSYASALALINNLIVPLQEYHCCINDCVIFRGENRDLNCCPECGEPRFAPGGQTPRKRFKYIPLRPRIQRYFSNAKSSQLLQTHHKSTSESGISDIHQTHVWKEWYSSTGLFRGDPRGLCLGLCLDGTNPFSKEKTTYSMWPMIISLMNLPRNLRFLPGFLQLVGIIPGRHEPKNTDPYLSLLVDELKDLNDCVLFDAFQNNTFQLRTRLLLHTLDYPGVNKVFHCHGELNICK